MALFGFVFLVFFFILIFFFFFFFWRLTQDLKTGTVKVTAVGWMEHPPKFYNVAEDFDCTLFFFFFFFFLNSHSKYHEMHCYRKSLPSQKLPRLPLRRRASPRPGPPEEGSSIALV